MKYLSIIFFTLASLITSAQNSDFAGIDLNSPCALVETYDDGSMSSYSCQSFSGDNFVGITFSKMDISSDLNALSGSARKAYIEETIEQLYLNAKSESPKTVKTTFYNMAAVETEDEIVFQGLPVKVKVIGFVYNNYIIYINFISNPEGFESRYNQFKRDINI